MCLTGKSETFEQSEPDTSEDDFVSEEFFKQKRLEAVQLSSTLKFTSDSSLALPPRTLSSTLPSRSISLPTDNALLDLPPLPIRLHKNKLESTGLSLYRQVNKNKLEAESEDSDEEKDDLYETAFDIPDETDDAYEAAFDLRDKTSVAARSVDRNTLVAQQDIEEDSVYEAAFDLHESVKNDLEKKEKNSVQLPEINSEFSGLEKMCSDKQNTSSDTEGNLYSEFNGGVSSSDSIKPNEDQKNREMSTVEVTDVVNNNVNVQNIYGNVASELKPKSSRDLVSDGINQTLKPKNIEPIYGNTEIMSKATDSISYIPITVESSKGGPVKPPRRNSKHASKSVNTEYANVSALGLENPKKSTQVVDSENLPMKSVSQGSASVALPNRVSVDNLIKSKQEVDPFQLPSRPRPVQENIYDFGRCTEPVKLKSDNVPLVNGDSKLSNLQGEFSRKDSSKKSKHGLPPPLELRGNQERSSSSSPDTPRRLIQAQNTKTNIETTNGKLDFPPSPPTTPVSTTDFDFSPIYKSVIKVDRKRQQTPSPQGRCTRRSSHSPKTKMVNGVSDATDIQDYSNQPIVKPRTKTNMKNGRPHSLIVMQTNSNDDLTPKPAVRKESLYSPVLTKKWFDKQPMAEINAQSAKESEKTKDSGIKEASSSKLQSKEDPIPAPFQPAGYLSMATLTADTTYQVPKRVRSVQHHEPQPSFINHDIPNKNLDNRCSSSSPSHDGFQFNVPSRQLSATDNDDGPHHYEDATGRHGEPPLPPRRKKDQSSSRSQSVYVPCNINQDPNRGKVLSI